MRVNIYYGGRGLIEDSTIYVMNSMTEILEELRVEVQAYNLYEQKNGINMLPKTLKEADGVILATHLEWFGIGGFMQQFLDACWLYGDRNEIGRMYMMPVVIASTYGERDAECTLIKAWELLGGIPIEGLCAYVEDHTSFETDAQIKRRIEKITENYYRSMSQRSVGLPNSSNEVRKKVLKTKALKLTPQESEQLSEYVSNDQYVKKQKEDIEELAMMFKGMLGEAPDEDNYVERIRAAYVGSGSNDNVSYQIVLNDVSKSIRIVIHEGEASVAYESAFKADVHINMSADVLEKIIGGDRSFQEAFMSGELSAKGNFNILRMLDTYFDFSK